MKRYLITDPDYYGSSASELELALDAVYSHHLPDFALFRDKSSSDYRSMAEVFLDISREYKIAKVFLHRDYTLASELGADGVHLNRYEDIKIAKSLGLEVVFSSHSIDDGLRAVDEGADYLTYSPIFSTPNKGEPVGLENLKDFTAKISAPIFALGGIIDDTQLQELEATGVYGFASIRYFVYSKILQNYKSD